MTIEQFAILRMLTKELGLIKGESTTRLPHQAFVDTLMSFTHDTSAPPYEIAPRLITRFDGADYTFDIYRFLGYRLNIYYSQNGSPTLFTVWGDGGALVFLREWAP
jgi:hypothetical protein